MLCPHCNKPVNGSTVYDALSGFHTSKTLSPALKCLMGQYPNVVTKDVLIRDTWGKYPPVHPQHEISRTMCRLRVQLADYGWTIDCVKDEGYKLRKLDEEKAAA